LNMLLQQETIEIHPFQKSWLLATLEEIATLTAQRTA
jgi:hypothetical protein